jgi:hypothetical protein
MDAEAGEKQEEAGESSSPPPGVEGQAPVNESENDQEVPAQCKWLPRRGLPWGGGGGKRKNRDSKQ